MLGATIQNTHEFFLTQTLAEQYFDHFLIKIA